VVILRVGPPLNAISFRIISFSPKGRWPVQRQEATEAAEELAQPGALAPSARAFGSKRDAI
jgi:hypothetical protein